MTSRKGVFAQANHGTLLIDEIGDLEPTLQPKLLRAIERSEIRSVGGSETVRVDVRILAATHRPRPPITKSNAVASAMTCSTVSPWRASRFPRFASGGATSSIWRGISGRPSAKGHPLPNQLFERWEDYSWPAGNVRELRNAVARRLALGDLSWTSGRRGPSPEDGHPRSGRSPATEDVIASLLAKNLPLPIARRQLQQEFERRYIERILAQHGGDTAAAAAASGIARRYFQLLLAKRTR